MRHQARDATIAVEKRVNPKQAMMCRRRCENGIGLSNATIDVFEVFQKPGNSSWTDGDMPRDLYIALA